MSLNGAQIARCNAAIAPARVTVANVEAGEGGGFTIFETAGSRLRATLDQVEADYRYLLSRDEPASEVEVASLVADANSISGNTVAALQAVEVHPSEWIPQGVKDAIESLGTVGKVTGVVVGILLVAYVWRSFK